MKHYNKPIQWCLAIFMCVALQATAWANNYTISQIRTLPAGIHGMAVADNGDLYFSDSFGNYSQTRRVYRLPAPYTGSFQATPITGQIPSGLLWDNNTLYIADTQANTIRQYDVNYNLLNSWSVNAPWIIKKASDGSFLITSFNNQVFRLNENGTVQTVLTNLAGPFGVEPAQNDTFWVSEQGGAAGAPGFLKRWSLNGVVQQEVVHNWDNPEGLQMDNDGNLWIADTGAGQVLRLSDAGVLETAASQLSFPVIITKMPNGDLLFNTSGGAPGLHLVDFEESCTAGNPQAQFNAVVNGSSVSFDGQPSTGCGLTYQWDFGDTNASTVPAPVHEYSTAGDYTVTLTVTDADNNQDSQSQTVSIIEEQTALVLTNDRAQFGLAAARNEQLFFVIDLPKDAINLEVTTSLGTGDADMYVKYGSMPTFSDYDCRPYVSGNAEACIFDAVQAGKYYIMLHGSSAFTDVQLKAFYETGVSGKLLNEVNLSANRGQTLSFNIDVPSGFKTLTVTQTNGTGDADLYVRFGSAPTSRQFDCRPYLTGNNEKCTFNNPSVGTWFINVVAWSSFSGVSLEAVAR